MSDRPKFKVVRFSDLQHEGMAVEIQYDGVPLAELSRDRGVDHMQIEIPSRFAPGSVLFPLDEFLAAVAEARELLAKLG